MLPTPETDWGFFLDVDGTLLEIAPTPDSVIVGSDVRRVLNDLYQATGGAVALISGRPLEQIDNLFAPLLLPSSGLHGLEVRTAQGEVLRPPPPSYNFERMRKALAAFASKHAGLLFEDKNYALALHYRLAPELEDDCRRYVRETLETWGNGYRLLDGKMVLEIKPAQADKGKVIETLMGTFPFTGRRPIYIGDDVTDEAGFAMVNQLGGHSIHVGTTDNTCAQFTVADITTLRAWLFQAADRIGPPQQRGPSPDHHDAGEKQ